MRRRAFLRTGFAAGVAGVGSASSPVNLMAFAAPRRSTDVIRLSSNENPLGLSPLARQAVIDNIPEGNRYPGASADALLDALVATHGLERGNFLLGAGSTEVLQMVVQAYSGPRTRLIIPDPTFEDVPHYSRPEQYELTTVPLDQHYGHDIGRMKELADHWPGTSMVYVCNPNNPTSTLTPCAAIDAWIQSADNDTIFIVDEAYFEFPTDPGYWSAIKWINERPNVVVVRTFSKIYGMAGLRLGFGLAHPDTINLIRRFSSSNSVSNLAARAGVASLHDPEMVDRSLSVNKQGRRIAHEALDALELEYLPSHTNFLMHRITTDLESYRSRMAEAGLAVGRPFPPMLDYNRVSIGLPEEMERWAETVLEFRKKNWI